MPKRGSDAGSRTFFDELVSLAASRLKATGAIRLEDRHGIIAFGEKQKLVGVAHKMGPRQIFWVSRDPPHHEVSGGGGVASDLTASN